MERQRNDLVLCRRTPSALNVKREERRSGATGGSEPCTVTLAQPLDVGALSREPALFGL